MSGATKFFAVGRTLRHRNSRCHGRLKSVWADESSLRENKSPTHVSSYSAEFPVIRAREELIATGFGEEAQPAKVRRSGVQAVEAC